MGPSAQNPAKLKRRLNVRSSHSKTLFSISLTTSAFQHNSGKCDEENSGFNNTN
jgi:hypothetical protein